MNGFIYKITNRVNNKSYIGQTRFTVEHRFKQHIKNYNIEHRKQPLYMAFDKYGLQNFKVETLEECDVDKLDEREIYWIAYYDTFRNGYNATLGGQKHSAKYFWTDNQYEEIKSLYLSGFSARYIAEKFKVSHDTIRSILKSMNVKMRNHGLDVNNVEAQEIITAYKEGLGIGFLARYYHTNFNEVKNFLLSKNMDLRQQISIKDDEDKIQLMIRDYLNKMPKRELELKYHCDYRTIKQILVMRKIELRNKNKFTDSEYLDIIRMYCDNNITITEITKRYKINITTIYKILKRFNIKFKRNNISKSVHSLKD